MTMIDRERGFTNIYFTTRLTVCNNGLAGGEKGEMSVKSPCPRVRYCFKQSIALRIDARAQIHAGRDTVYLQWLSASG